MTKSIVLEAQNISLKNRLVNVSFKIPQGSIIAFSGGNGAGKTSLMTVLLGLTKHKSGTIYYKGKQITKYTDEIKSTMSYMPDSLQLPDQMSAKEVLMFFADIMGKSKDDVESTLSFVGLESQHTKRMKFYSKGMLQRVNFAQCLLKDADVILLDEPTNGLDPYWNFLLKSRLLSLKEAGKTIIISTHQMSLVEEIADRLIYLESGRVLIDEELHKLTPELDTTLESYIFKKIEDSYKS